jgi:hypothetical protein
VLAKLCNDLIAIYFRPCHRSLVSAIPEATFPRALLPQLLHGQQATKPIRESGHGERGRCGISVAGRETLKPRFVSKDRTRTWGGRRYGDGQVLGHPITESFSLCALAPDALPQKVEVRSRLLLCEFYELGALPQFGFELRFRELGFGMEWPTLFACCDARSVPGETSGS